MARRSPFEPDPEFEYPLAYRLAQFLLGSSEQLGQYTQGLGVQSKGASDVLESMERQDIARDELGRRTQADLLTAQDRAATLEERRREADLKAELARQTAEDRRATAAETARRKRAAGALFSTPTTQDQPFRLEGVLPATERGAPDMEVGAPLPIFQDLVGRRRTTLQSALQGLGPDLDALTADDLAKAAKIFPESMPAKGAERKAQLEADVLESLPPEQRAVAAFPSLKDKDAAEKNPFAGLDPTKLDAIVATPDDVLDRTDLAKQFGGASATKRMAQDALTRIEGRTTRQGAATAGAVEKARLAVPNPMRTEEAKLWRQTITTQDKLDDIEELVQSPKVNLAKISGGIQPWVNEILQTGKLGPIPVDPKTFGGPLTREENMLLAAMQDAADLTLRQRSGAAINEQEFKRMLQFIVTPGVRPEVILDRLALQRHNNARELDVLEHQARESQFIVPSRPTRRRLLEGSPAAVPPGVTIKRTP